MRFFPIFQLLLLVICLPQAFSQGSFNSGNKQYSSKLELEKSDSALHFIAIGDWGKSGGDFQRPVATQMAIAAEKLDADFIVSTGDNFYPAGVKDTLDPLFQNSFEKIYNQKSLQVKWYPVLGNHDYMANPDAQIEYSNTNSRWSMPSRYYSKKFAIDGDTSQQVLILFLDTNPLVKLYHKKQHYGNNIKSQKPAEQKEWIRKELETASPSVKWKIIVGHHPIHTGGHRRIAYDTRAVRRQLKPLFSKYKVDAYISGHEHNLQHLKVNKITQQFISGAGSEVLSLKTIPKSKLAKAVPGFMTFSVKEKQLLMQAVSIDGEVVYKTRLSKH
ncbi:purple acid phosphatase family protein [Desertivirga brevis]|uniref:purple acid phosphatase family protein n=1 Tax=Desertivirga brevis TaxID=2810310 RepID=UPI001A96AC8A|nr:tartrate-resistant acid phosphatase type 5 family protein [Pedobacter sp. SYSU D00873]